MSDRSHESFFPQQARAGSEATQPKPEQAIETRDGYPETLEEATNLGVVHPLPNDFDPANPALDPEQARAIEHGVPATAILSETGETEVTPAPVWRKRGFQYAVAGIVAAVAGTTAIVGLSGSNTEDDERATAAPTPRPSASSTPIAGGVPPAVSTPEVTTPAPVESGPAIAAEAYPEVPSPETLQKRLASPMTLADVEPYIDTALRDRLIARNPSVEALIGVEGENKARYHGSREEVYATLKRSFELMSPDALDTLGNRPYSFIPFQENPPESNTTAADILNRFFESTVSNTSVAMSMNGRYSDGAPVTAHEMFAATVTPDNISQDFATEFDAAEAAGKLLVEDNINQGIVSAFERDVVEGQPEYGQMLYIAVAFETPGSATEAPQDVIRFYYAAPEAPDISYVNYGNGFELADDGITYVRPILVTQDSATIPQ